MERVLITGCSSGFGLKTTLLLGKHNFEVVATTRHKDFKFNHPNITHQYLDMKDLPTSVDDYDIVIFNAGVLDAGLAEHICDASIDEMMEVNVSSIMKLSKLIIPRMKEKKKGKLIFISSMAAIRPLPNLSVYNASKAAIDAYAKSLYLELAPFNIEVFLVEPGFYQTSLWDDVKKNNDEYAQILNNLGKNSKKTRGVEEVTFQILKICQGKTKALHHPLTALDRLMFICNPFIYTKIGKMLFKSIIFKFQNMKTQK